MAFIFTAASFLLTNPTQWFPLFLILIWIPCECLEMRSAHFHQKAERLKRLHELADGLGIAPDSPELATAEAAVGQPNPKRLVYIEGLEFASQSPPSPKRAIENLRESAWFSQQLSSASALRSAGLCVAFLVISILIPLIHPYLLKAPTNANEVLQLKRDLVAGTLVSSSIVLGLFSLGVAKRAIGLFRFSKASEQTVEETSRRLSERKAPTKFDAIQILNQYQIERASSPPISSRIWIKKKDRLNALYQKHFPEK